MFTFSTSFLKIKGFFKYVQFNDDGDKSGGFVLDLLSKLLSIRLNVRIQMPVAKVRHMMFFDSISTFAFVHNCNVLLWEQEDPLTTDHWP